MEEDLRDESSRVAIAARLVDERLDAAVDGLSGGIRAAMGKEGQQVFNVPMTHTGDFAHGVQGGAQSAAEPFAQVLVARLPVRALPELPEQFLELPSLGGLAGDGLGALANRTLQVMGIQDDGNAKNRQVHPDYLASGC